MRFVILTLTFLILVFGSVAAQDGRPDCPTISVTGPAGIVQPGEKFVFTGSIDGTVPKDLTFRWEIAGGKIVDGQGTLKMMADAEWRPDGATVTATLNIVGLPEGCPKSASETGAVAVCFLDPILIDEFGRLPSGSVRTKLDNFFAELSDNPNNQGYIILYGTKLEIAKRERFIVNGIAFRNQDRSRITIVRGGTHESGKIHTKLWRVPPGANNPTP